MPVETAVSSLPARTAVGEFAFASPAAPRLLRRTKPFTDRGQRVWRGSLDSTRRTPHRMGRRGIPQMKLSSS